MTTEQLRQEHDCLITKLINLIGLEKYNAMTSQELLTTIAFLTKEGVL